MSEYELFLGMYIIEVDRDLLVMKYGEGGWEECTSWFDR